MQESPSAGPTTRFTCPAMRPDSPSNRPVKRNQNTMLGKKLELLLLLAIFASPLTLADGPFETFSEDRLAALQAEGQTVLVEVYADWCSTCRRQSPILSELLKDEQFAGITGLKLDWDDQRSQAQALGAPRQSTLILYVGSERIDTSVAETNPERLREFLAQADTAPGS
ncbi:MAG: thioredoxin [Wenzhouxiangella sp.]|nr:MAG: thioredoxin [Wenzhouxiangella sp.]